MLIVGGGQSPYDDVDSFEIIISSTVLVILDLMSITTALLIVRRKRLAADQWLEENSTMLINFALQKRN